jgi:hypothetical protein
MGRGSFGASLGVCALVLVFVSGIASLGCQPLYGGKPEKLVAPQKKKAPPEAAVTETPIKEVDDCIADFRGDAKSVKQLTSQANQLTEEGNTAMANADKAAQPSAQAGLLKESIDRYRSALIKDPYHAEATLKLALAYDKVYRKGCAIAMLKRLLTLTANPRFAKAATNAIESISDNGQWFKRYHKDAMAAVGR